METTGILASRASLRALVSQHRDLEESYLDLSTRPSRVPGLEHRSAADPRLAHYRPLITTTTHALELTLLSVGWCEIALELGLTQFSAMQSGDFARIDALNAHRSGLDQTRVLADNRAVLEKAHAQVASGDTVSITDLFQGGLHAARVLVAQVPVDTAEAIARGLAMVTEANRIRVAYDRLRALLRRQDLEHDGAAHVAGRAYAEGRLSVAEVARIMGCNVPDAVAFLEAHGFFRPLEKIRLDEETRARALAAIRADRLRGGPAANATSSIGTRDVIASQRIEGVDARPWLPATRD